VNLRQRLARRAAHLLLGNAIEELVAQRLAADRTELSRRVSVRVDDAPGWESLSGGGPADRPWADKYADLEETLEAWRRNFFVRRLVTLTRSYAVGSGISVASDDPDVDRFVQAFWNHRQNRMEERLGPTCDELTRAGEIFPVLFTNRVDGMSYVRFVPASRIRAIETDPHDYETELRYAQTRRTSAEPRWWIGPGHPSAFKLSSSSFVGTAKASEARPLPPLMLHFAVNKPIGATRGESDLLPVLPWARRYSEWLKDRVRLNRIRTRQAILHLRISDGSLVEQKRQQIRTDNPIEKGIYVSGPDEELLAHDLSIGAGDAEDDGRALRLAVATGGNVGLHYLGEGETVNYATAREMGEPTSRFYAERQQTLINLVLDMVRTAYRRFCIITGRAYPGDDALRITAAAGEVARQDNESLASAARDVVLALARMKRHGWVDDHTAVRLALKFAGEPLGQGEIERILAAARPTNGEAGSVEGSGGGEERGSG
jgi:hypothetical protein